MPVADSKVSKKNKTKSKYPFMAPNPMAKIPLYEFPNLVDLRIVNSPTVTNQIFEVIIENCEFLKHLEFGGKPQEYNNLISLEGIRVLCGSEAEGKDEFSDEEYSYRESMGLKSSLEVLKIHYCVKVGSQTVEMV